ncbi:Flp pilus assembly complex ATPase component TadA [Ornithinibacillus sp. BX22]|uniref:Flp pilus assembly complex ATPase component TadA n=1 Tax=Ornithinibacillus hominis TaxID=2763055 RepID=A0A923L657_9BACI|nr:competence type IV pilus ATPase ComGA [Ornithinibacillus hominis]MBC5637198.1 Flp pilus assembly complex ATPase component TadA [Ornithinibacillus hominis]
MTTAERLSRHIITNAIENQATDIHFYPFETTTNIYFRVYGKRILYQSISTNRYESLLTYYKFTSGMDIGENRKPQNGTLFHSTKSDKYSLRLSTLPVNQLESLAIRLLPQQQNLSLEQLFLFKQQLHTIKTWMNPPAGLILFSGPTGSGKTTTLYALLESALKDESFLTITLEDPIEKNIQDILQVQVNEKAGITYQTGLKAALRHDPDIIMVGEIRDRETAKFAFEASLTGHLVLSTIHAKNTQGTIHRLLEMGITPSELEQSLIGIASIQLLSILTCNPTQKRAAILEILDGELLSQVINGIVIDLHESKHSFEYLRRKAYIYGFISKDTFETF